MINGGIYLSSLTKIPPLQAKLSGGMNRGFLFHKGEHMCYNMVIDHLKGGFDAC